MQGSISKSAFLWMIALAAAVQLFAGGTAEAQQPRKPNILVLFGDDMGYWNVERLQPRHHGLQNPQHRPHRGRKAQSSRPTSTRQRGSRRPRRVHHRSVADSDGPPQGRTAERARGPVGKEPDDCGDAQRPRATPAASSARTIWAIATRFIPTVHGFDEFLGNFYHLNAEEEPENPDYAKDPAFKARFGPRGVFHCYATATVSTLPAPKVRQMGQAAAARTPARSPKSGWKPWMKKCSPRPSSSSTRTRRPADPGSPGSTPRACTSTRTSSRRPWERQGWASKPTAWSNATG